MASNVLYLDPGEPYSIPASAVKKPPSPANRTAPPVSAKMTPPQHVGTAVKALRSSIDVGQPAIGKKYGPPPKKAQSTPRSTRERSESRGLAARSILHKTPYQELFDTLIRHWTPDPEGDAELQAVARTHWTGPSFKLPDWQEATAIVRRYEVPLFGGALHNEAPAVKALFVHAFTLEAQLLNAARSDRARLLSRLSATSLAAWIVSQGDAGGELPWAVELGH